jgi:hypothetical protein
MNSETYVLQRDDLRIHTVDRKFREMHAVGCVIDVFVPCNAESERFHLEIDLKFVLNFLKIYEISRCPVRHTRDKFVLKQNMLIFIKKLGSAERNWPVSLRTRITKLSPAYENEADSLF